MLNVHHFGPHPDSVGGMASVIRVLTENAVGADRAFAQPTWLPRSPAASAALAARAALALRRLPAGTIVHVHLSERGSFLREGALLALARRRGLAVVGTLHGASFSPFAESHPRVVGSVLRRAHVLTCLHEHDWRLVQAAAPSVRCEIVPNPVVVEPCPRTVERTDELVLFAGEIGMRKGADVLYRAWRLIADRRPSARCIMVGPLGDFLPPAAERLEVREPVSPAELARLMQQARVVALPARAEGMPMALTEAMGAGRPIVGTPVGAIPELADAGGVLVPVGDEVQLADRLIELLADPALARRIGERGRRFCLDTRSVQALDGRLRELYAQARTLSAHRFG